MRPPSFRPIHTLRRAVPLVLALAMAAGLGGTRAAEESDVRRAPFTLHWEAGAEGAPEGWRPVTFENVPRATRYTVRPAPDAGAGTADAVLEATAERSASGLVWEGRFDPRALPWLSWRWRTDAALPEADVRAKATDDTAGRVMALFPYDPEHAGVLQRMQYALYHAMHGRYPPGAVIAYAWTHALPQNGWVPSAYEDTVRIVAVTGADTSRGDWVAVRRHIPTDFAALFGRPLPTEATLSVMVDTDNTQGRAHTLLGPLRLSAGPDDGADEPPPPVRHTGP